MMNILTHKRIIVFALITLVLVLALPSQSSQASLPGQTVPTVKPRDKKSSDESTPNQSTTSTPEWQQNLYYSTPEPSLPTATMEENESQTPGTVAPGGLAVQTVAATPTEQGNPAYSDSSLIPFIFSSNPAPKFYEYMGYAIIALVFILFLSYQLFKKDRKEKTAGAKKPE